MKYYQKKIRKNSKEVKKVKQFLKAMDIKYSMQWLDFKAPWNSVYTNERIYVYIHNQSVQQFLSTVFHELGHEYQKFADKFVAYRNGFESDKDTFECFKNWALEAYKSEIDADTIGREAMRSIFPDIPFKPLYSKTRGKKFIIKRVEYLRRTNFPKYKPLTHLIERQ